MRWLLLALMGGLLALPARAEDIVEVLRRSQQLRLNSLPAAVNGAQAQVLQRSFEQLRPLLPADLQVELRMVGGAVAAETLLGHVVVVHAALADLPEGERLFILAHELGHVVGGHWQQLGRLYQRWVPGEVTREKTDPVAQALGREASGLSHRHEYEADVFALQALRSLSRPSQDAYASFVRQGLLHDTATHPGTRKRIASLRAAELGAGLPVTGADAE